MKVFLLGLDGFTLKIVEPYVKAELLPNFKKIINNGSYGVLHSTIPSTTPPGWTSLATGKNPGKHGIYEFRRKKGYDTELITKNTSPHAESLWNILSRQGKEVIVVNVPFAYPPDEVNGVMISGLMTPNVEADFIYPKQLKKDVFKLIPDYQLDIDEHEYMFSNDINNLLQSICKMTEDEKKLMCHFLDNTSWDLFYIIFIGPDRLQHIFWDDIVSMKPACVAYYQLLDNILGDIIKRLEDDTILFVVTDHGFMQTRKGFYINNYFQELGLLQFRESQSVRNRLAQFDRYIRGIGIPSIKKVLPSCLINYLKKFRSDFVGIGHRDINWKKTKVFSLLGNLIYINLKGREPQGIVEKDEYELLCKQVKSQLLQVKDPETDEPVIKDVKLGRELYATDYGNDVPDLVVINNEGYSTRNEAGQDVLAENRVGNRHLTGEHDMYGLYMAYGNMINHKIMDAHIYDIMPTILYLMGSSIPEDVDGRVLTELINNDFLKRNKIKYTKTSKQKYPKETTLNKEEKEGIEKRLKALGYLS